MPKGTSQAAERAADRAFSVRPSLPLDEDATGDRSLEGMRRLKGAFCIAVDRIRPDPNQPRKNLETDARRELTASVQEHGILQAIAVRRMPGSEIFQIISGERRYHAALAAGLAEIPCCGNVKRIFQVRFSVNGGRITT